MAMNFQLKDFDGPLDLLVTLIGKAQIDIRDIFVSDITDQYLQIVRNAPDLNMDEASGFLVMAATLVEIKSRAMLPSPKEPEEDEEDPETELIRRLEEYKRYKESAENLRDFEEAAKNVFTKLPEEYPVPPQEIELTGLTLEGLTEAFLRIWKRKPEAETENDNHYQARNIHRDQHTVQDCMLQVLKSIRKKKKIRFDEMLSEAPTREEVTTYFLAILELLKLGQMHVEQSGICGDILLIHGRPSFVEYKEEPILEKGLARKRKAAEAGINEKTEKHTLDRVLEKKSQAEERH